MTENSDLDDALTALEQTAIKHRYSEARTKAPPIAPRRYDFTALSTAATCPRLYVLEYILGLPPEIGSSDEETDAASEPHKPSNSTPKPARVGTLFHIVAEQCWPTDGSATAWKDRAAVLAVERGWEDCLPRVEALIDAFFDSPVTDWQVKPAHTEARFEFDIDGRTVTGAIDAIPIRDDGKAVILDYKTGQAVPDEKQLLVYLLATQRDDSLTLPATPGDSAFLRMKDEAFELESLGVRDIEETISEAEEVLREWIEVADTASYEDPRPGEYCSSCPYRGVCDAADEG